jgi:hypothetical protein
MERHKMTTETTTQGKMHPDDTAPIAQGNVEANTGIVDSARAIPNAADCGLDGDGGEKSKRVAVIKAGLAGILQDHNQWFEVSRFVDCIKAMELERDEALKRAETAEAKVLSESDIQVLQMNAESIGRHKANQELREKLEAAERERDAEIVKRKSILMELSTVFDADMLCDDPGQQQKYGADFMRGIKHALNKDIIPAIAAFKDDAYKANEEWGDVYYESEQVKKQNAELLRERDQARAELAAVKGEAGENLPRRAEADLPHDDLRWKAGHAEDGEPYIYRDFGDWIVINERRNSTSVRSLCRVLYQVTVDKNGPQAHQPGQREEREGRGQEK